MTLSENSYVDMNKGILWINVIFYPDEPIQCINLALCFQVNNTKDFAILENTSPLIKNQGPVVQN